MALPNWQQPRLFLPVVDGPLQRWKMAKLYPAYKNVARLYRSILKFRAFSGSGEIRKTKDNSHSLEAFLKDHFPQPILPVVMLGTPGPTQKVIMQLWHPSRGIVAYLKYAEKEKACLRLEKEYHVLSKLPSDIGPRPLKKDNIGNGKGLLITPVQGKPLSVKLPPHPKIEPLLQQLYSSKKMAIDAHPAIRSLYLRNTEQVERWIDVLGQRKWEIVIEHGDFAPWNILQSASGSISVIDWEYGNHQGFPFLDLLYYFFQISFLVKHWSALKATNYIKAYLKNKIVPGYEDREITALLIRLLILWLMHELESQINPYQLYYKITRKQK